MSRLNTVQRELIDGVTITGWDGTPLDIMGLGDKDIHAASGGTYPGPTIRVPRGVIFHAETVGKGPPPHTIHWHGIEPTPMNDGVGHTSMEIGQIHLPVAAQLHRQLLLPLPPQHGAAL